MIRSLIDLLNLTSSSYASTVTSNESRGARRTRQLGARGLVEAVRTATRSGRDRDAVPTRLCTWGETL